MSRIIPPYLLTIIGTLLASYLINRFIWYAEFNLNWKEIIVNAFYLADLFPDVNWINPIFSTLKVEFQFYILIGLLYPILNKIQLFFAITTIIFLILGVYWIEFDTVFKNSPFFFSGICLFLITTKKNPKINLLILFSIFIILGLFYPYKDMVILIISLLLIYFLPTDFKVLKLSGQISYSLYLTHGIFGGWFIFFARDFSFLKGNPILIVFIAFIISWICAYIMYYIIEKPSIKLSKSITYKND